MQELMIFNNEEFGEIRTTMINNEPWFVGKDVCERLGYKESNKAITRHVYEDDRTKHPIYLDTRTRTTWLINESGLYALIFGSQLDSAKRFKRWVTSEVLPELRRTGSYSLSDEKLEVAKIIASCKSATAVKSIMQMFNLQPKTSAPLSNKYNNLPHDSVSAFLQTVTIDSLERQNTKVYADYITFCSNNQLRFDKLATFSKKICRYANMTTRRRRENGDLKTFYEKL